MNDKTATECLRELLDERGVKWCPSAWDRSTETYWKTADGNGCLAIQGETKLRLSFADYLTPEQAIEATLGRGTCHDSAGEQMAFFSCSACGATIERKHPRFCFACGRKVVDE